MDFNSLLSIAKEFFNTQPYITSGILVIMLGLLYFKPRIVFKSLVGIGCVVLCGYLFLSLKDMLDSGVQGRDSMLEMESGGN